MEAETPKVVRPKGKPTFYPGKLPQPITSNFTPVARQLLKALSDDVGSSVSDVQEHLFRKFIGLPLNAELDAKLDVGIPKIVKKFKVPLQ